MKRYIQTAEYKRYNANNRGTDTGDCVKRALSMAFDMDYVAVGRELNAIMKEQRASAWNTNIVFESFIRNHGGGHIMKAPDNTKTLEETVDSLGSGVYLFETSRKPGQKAGWGDHLVCAIDGQIFDSWDSRRQYVTGYWIVEGRNALELTDIQDHLKDLSIYAQKVISQHVEKYFNKHDLHNIGRWQIGYIQYEGYSIKINVHVHLYPDGEDNDSLDYHFKLAYVFKPTTTLEQARKQIEDVTKVRIYDRFYTIIHQLNDHREAIELYKKAGHGKNEGPFLPYSGVEERFFNSLPGWVKPFVTDVFIQSPGQYIDSYDLRILPLPGDPDNSKVSFYGYESSTIKEELARYKNDFSRPGVDYQVSEIC